MQKNPRCVSYLLPPLRMGKGHSELQALLVALVNQHAYFLGVTIHIGTPLNINQVALMLLSQGDLINSIGK